MLVLEIARHWVTHIQTDVGVDASRSEDAKEFAVR